MDPKVAACLDSIRVENVNMDDMTVFDSMFQPEGPLVKYAELIFLHALQNDPFYIRYAVQYAAWYVSAKKMTVTVFNIRNLLLVACGVTQKFWIDYSYENTDFAAAAGISLSEYNKMEREFLFGIQFDLYAVKTGVSDSSMDDALATLCGRSGACSSSPCTGT